MRRREFIAGLIQRSISLAVLAAIIFSGAGRAFAQQPPSFAKTFGSPFPIPVHGSTSLTFTVDAFLNAFTITGLAFTDALPAGLVISTPNGLVNFCGGTVAATSGSNTIALSGGFVNPMDGCHLIVNVTATSIGTMTYDERAHDQQRRHRICSDGVP